MTPSQNDAHAFLAAQRAHLAELLEAIQRCVYFLHACDASLPWPLSVEVLTFHKKNTLFGALATVNERFSKLQDPLGSTIRHSLLLFDEQADRFLKVLAIYEKLGVVSSRDDWQTAHSARNFAAYVDVRPSITGHWQVSRHSSTTFDHRITIGLWYDTVILLRTMSVAARQEGAC